MISYLMVFGATMMFGLQFFFSGKYQEKAGSTLFTSMIFALGMGLVGIAALFIINGVGLALTWFTFLMALASAVNSMLFTFCSIYSLKHINLSIYSLFSMVGGMLFPFVAGIVFYNEGFTVAKLLCIITLFAALLLTVKKGEKSDGKIYYLGVFFFNGMGALLSVIFKKADAVKTTDVDFSVAAAGLKVILSAIIIAVILIAGKVREKKAGNAPSDVVPEGDVAVKKLKFTPIMLVYVAICGSFSYLANYILLIAMNNIPASLNYLLVTGGVMVCSSVLGYITGKKPTVRDLASVGICIVGMLLLFLPF